MPEIILKELAFLIWEPIDEKGTNCPGSLNGNESELSHLSNFNRAFIKLKGVTI